MWRKREEQPKIQEEVVDPVSAALKRVFSITEKIDEKQNEKNEYGLTKEYRDSILDTMIHSYIPSGEFLYDRDKKDVEKKENGGYKFSQVAKAELYNKMLPQVEKRLLTKFAQKFRPHIINKKQEYVDLGPGESMKVYDLIREMAFNKRMDDSIDISPQAQEAFHYLEKIGKIIWIDQSLASLEKYEETLLKNIKNAKADHLIKVEVKKWDIKNAELYNHFINQIYIFLWGTIGNFYSSDIVNLLKNLQSNEFRKSTKSVITYFVDETQGKSEKEQEDIINKLKATYGDPDLSNPYYDSDTHEKIEDFILSWCEALWLPREKLEFVVKYDIGGYAPAKIKVGARVKEGEEITIDIRWKLRKIWSWEYLRAIQSQRFTHKQFEEIAKEGWYFIKGKVTDQGIAVALLQSKRWMHQKFKKQRNWMFGLLIASVLVSWSRATLDILKENIRKSKLKKQQIEQLQKKIIYNYGDMYGKEYTELQDKERFVSDLVRDIYTDITIRYGKIADEEWCKSFINDEVLKEENLRTFFDVSNKSSSIVKFADRFVRDHPKYILSSGADITPYNNLKSHENKMINVINIKLSPEDIKEKINITCPSINENRANYGSTTGYGKYQTLSGSSYDIGSFNEKGGIQSSAVIVTADPYRYHFLLAGSINLNDGGDNEGREISYNVNDAQVVAYDYFEQTRPVVQKILEYFNNLYLQKKYDPYRQRYWIMNDYRELIIKDLINTWKIDRIQENKRSEIVAYVLSFMKKNKEILKKKEIESMPYAELGVYEDALYNVLWEDQKKWANDIDITNEKDREKKWFIYLGEYVLQTGEVYKMGVTERNGKKYLLGQDKDTEAKITKDLDGERVHTNWYYMDKWAVIAKDYLDLQKKSKL